MLIKIGNIDLENIRLEDSNNLSPMVEESILNSFRKQAQELKKIAPKADDFLYFSAIMMHAAEASAINDDGTPKLTKKGEPVDVSWDTSTGTWKWKTNDPTIKPYKNANGDIFPEKELVKAYKKWKHKPLCIDHKSSSIDHTRGFIVDTYYDPKLKRVIALCALDKVNYPDLARKVSTGYSHSVSMGTAVGRAVCTEDGCHKVARVESDFCQHMRSKSGYGEINLDLNPIELSIVVNGADPKAHIKEIVASANTLNNYIEKKEQQLNKMSEYLFSGSFSASNNNDDTSAQKVLNVANVNFEEFKASVIQALDELEHIKKEAKKISDDSDMDNSSSDQVVDNVNDSEANVSTVSLAPPVQRLAEENLVELNKVASKIESKLNRMIEKLNTFEEKMAGENLNKKGYFLGTEEPTPGESKYPKDPTNEKLREEEDKQMNVDDTGPVDGMHPGPKSVGMSELERKRMLARADIEERALKRAAILENAKRALSQKTAQVNFVDLVNNAVFELNKQESSRSMANMVHGALKSTAPVEQLKQLFTSVGFNSVFKDHSRFPATAALYDRVVNNKQASSQDNLKSEGYFQGGGGVNEPAPGERKYPVDKMNEDLREDGDKHMVGQKPFPNVGNVDGLHPSPDSADVSDEKKRKELMNRASYSGKFFKEVNADGSTNFAKSAWQIFYNGNLVLTASVDNLSGGNSDLMFESIANKDFGKKLINKVKTAGVKSVTKSFNKVGQQDPQMAPSAPPAPPAAAPAPDMGSEMVEQGDPTAKGDVGNSLSDLVEEASELANKLPTLISDIKDGVNEMAGEKLEMGSPESMPNATASDRTLHSLHRELNLSLREAMTQVAKQLKLNHQELSTMASEINQMAKAGGIDPSNKVALAGLVKESIEETKGNVSEALALMGGFVRYARGAMAMVKTAEMQKEFDSMSSDDVNEFGDEDTQTDHTDFSGLEDLLDEDLGDDTVSTSDLDEDTVVDEDGLDLDSDTLLDENDLQAKPDELKNLTVKPGTKVEVVASDLTSKESRSALRVRLAAENSLKMSPMLDLAHKHVESPKFDLKPSMDLGKLEDVEEVHEKMLDFAKAPVRVRKDAETIHKLVSEGKISKEDIDTLTSQGVDKDAVAYYKKYFGQTDGGSEFATELTKEHVKAELTKDVEQYKVKLARAYDLVNDMVRKGLVHDTKVAFNSEVDKLLKMDDYGFDSVRRLVDKNPIVNKTASLKMPQVGQVEYPEQAAKTTSLQEQLGSLISGKSRTQF